MKIQDLLNKKVMLLDLQATTKEAAIDEMINSLVDNGVVADFENIKVSHNTIVNQAVNHFIDSSFFCSCLKVKQHYFFVQ